MDTPIPIHVHRPNSHASHEDTDDTNGPDHQLNPVSAEAGANSTAAPSQEDEAHGAQHPEPKPSLPHQLKDALVDIS